MSRKSAYFVWIIASIFYSYQYLVRVMPNIMMGEIFEQFNINTIHFGQFSGIYYIGYSLLHMPIGIALDRFGPKKVLPLCMMLTSIGSLPLIMAENWLYPLMGRFLIGVGSSASILGAFKIIRMGFREEHFTRMLSLSVTIGLLGAIYGGGPVAYMKENLGYENVLMLLVASGIVLALISYLSIPKLAPTTSASVLTDLKIVFSNKKVVSLCLFAGLMVGPLEGFADVWGAEFLKKVYGFESVKSGYLTSLIFVGMCFGAPILSFVAEKTNSYMGSITGAALIMCFVFAALLSEMLDMFSISIGFIIVGICCAYQILAIYKASTYVPEHASSLTTSVANMIIMVFGYGFHTMIGLIVNIYADQGSTSYIYGIAIIPLSLAIGAVGCLLISLDDRRIAKKEQMAELV